jgi:transposase
MPIALRTDFDSVTVRSAARNAKDGAQARRLLALAAIYEGASRTEAARLGSVTVQIVRDWVVKFNATGPEGLIDKKAPGKPPRLNATHRAALVEAIERGPIPAAHGVVRWRIIDLAQMLWDDFSVSVSRPTLSRELRALGYRKLSARPKHHAQDPEAIEAFKRGLCSRAGHGQSHAPSRHTDRNLVSGRGQDRAEEQDHATMGQARDATLGAARSADEIGLYLRRNLPAGGKSGRSRPALLQHRYYEPASGRDILERRARRSRRGADGSGRMAPDAEARASCQYLDRRDPLEMSRAQSAGKYLAVHARQLAVEPCVRLLR